MKHKIRKFRLIFICLLPVVCITSVTAWHHDVKVDTSKVHPSFLALDPPFQIIRTEIYDDGGSKAVIFVDSNEKTVKYMLPHFIFGSDLQGKLFIGNHMDGKIIDEEVYPDTRSALFAEIDNRPDSQYQDFGVGWKLATHPLDKIRILIKKSLGYYKLD